MNLDELIGSIVYIVMIGATESTDAMRMPTSAITADSRSAQEGSPFFLPLAKY